MPIWDNNGTTSYVIGKLYDHNGTTMTQIGKVYDNNGTTASLIYTAEEPIFDPSQADPYCTALSGGWEISNRFDTMEELSVINTSMLRAGKAGGYGPEHAYVVISNKTPINLSNYSKAYVTYYTTSESTAYATWAFGFNATKGNRGGQVSGHNQVATTTATIDLGSSTGNQYFNIYAYTTGGGIECSLTVTKIILE